MLSTAPTSSRLVYRIPFGRHAQVRYTSNISESLRCVMRNVPQPVVVVTSAHSNSKRGVTVSSFTTVSLTPPLVSFCIRIPSRLSQIAHRSRRFLLHILSKDQVHIATAFSNSDLSNLNPEFFASPVNQNDSNEPLILRDVLAALDCSMHSVHPLGDHELWIGAVQQIITPSNAKGDPLLYYKRTYRTIGDHIYMDNASETPLDLNQSTHRNHLRIAFNYLAAHPPEEAIPFIRNGIKKYNDRHHTDNIPHFAFHETITGFFFRLLYLAMQTNSLHHSMDFDSSTDAFHAFLKRHSWLLDTRLYEKFYSKELIFSDSAKEAFIEPDLYPLPTSLPHHLLV